MKVCVFVSTKGGVGKSTLAEALAVEAGKDARVFLADLDPQQSTAAWWRRRKGPDNPMLVVNIRSVGHALETIRKRHAERDWVIIDTPGSNMQVIGEAIRHADVVVAVIQASGKDLEAQAAAEDLIRDAGKSERTLWVINRVNKANKLARDAAEKVAAKSAVPPVLICDRVDYVRADLEGKAANEVNREAAKEIAALWQAVKGVAQ